MARAGWQRRLEKYFSNPMVKAALHLGVAPKSFALLETIGRAQRQSSPHRGRQRTRR
jgi:hypothetical protein